MRTAFAVAGAVSLALGSFGCDTDRVEETTTEELRFDIGDDTVVEVRIDYGRVDVVAGSAGVVEVVFENRARAADRAGARALLANVHTRAARDGDVVRVGARAAGQSTLGGAVWSDVTLRVPPNAIVVDIRIDDGRIGIDGVSGSIFAETGDGNVRVTNVSGTVTLRTHDGSITGTELAGDFDVLSDDGRIRLDGSFGRLRAVTGDGSVRVRARDASAVTGAWSIRTSDGSIDVSLPEALGAELDVSSAEGRINNALSGFRGTEHDNRITGILGSGGPRIMVTTMDGAIELDNR